MEVNSNNEFIVVIVVLGWFGVSVFVFAYLLISVLRLSMTCTKTLMGFNYILFWS